MAISYIAAGLAANNATSAAIPYPAGIAAGDLLLLTAVAKYSAYTSAPPTGFTLLKEQVGGSGGTGVDAGDVRLAVWYKVATGSETGTISVTKATQSGSVILGRMFLWRRTAGSGWQVTATSGTDGAGGTSWSVTGAANLNFDTGDAVVMVSGMNTDAATYTGHAISATGATFGTLTERQDSGTTTGDDVALLVAEGPVNSGPSLVTWDNVPGTWDSTGLTWDSATSIPTYTATASTGTPEGASIIIRLREARMVTAAAGSYVLTGPDARLQAPASIPNAWVIGSWYAGAWYGTAWYASQLKVISAARGTFTLTGEPITFHRTYRIVAGTGSITLTGRAVTFRRTTIMPAAQGAYAVTGSAVNLEYHPLIVRTIAADQIPYEVTGEDANFRLTRRMEAGIGNYLLTGQSTTLTPSARKLVASQGSITLTGNIADFLRSNVVGKGWAEGAWYSGAWKGTAWAADYTGLTNYTMPASSGEYDVLGIDTPFRVGHHIDPETGIYVYTGDDALRDMLFHADEGAYALTGVNARGGHGRPITAASGVYAATGGSATFLYGRRMPSQFGAYLVIGGDATFTVGVGAALTYIPYELTGQDATFHVTYRLAADSGSYVLTGQDARINFGNIFNVETIPYQLAGQDATLSRTWYLRAETGIYHLTGLEQEPRRKKRPGGKPPKHHKHDKILVEIDGEEYLVGSVEEANLLLQLAVEKAKVKAREELDKALESRQRPSRVKSVVAHKLRPPEITVDASAEFLASVERQLDEARQKIKEIYDDALRSAEIGILLRRQQEQQEDEDFVIGLFL